MPAYRSHGSHITATTTTTRVVQGRGGQRGRAVAGSLLWYNNAAEEPPHHHDDADDDDDDDDDNALSQIFNELNNVLLLRQPQQGSPHEGHVLELQLPLLAAAVCFGCGTK